MIAQEIYKQLGGNKFASMTGASFYSDNDNRTLVVKFKGSPIANLMRITLNDSDLYDVEILKFKGLNVKTVAEYKSIYAENLHSVFQDTTGLKTSL